MSAEIERPTGFNSELEFEDYFTKVLGNILSNLRIRGVISNYYVFRHLGFDLAIFLDKNGKSRVRFLELKLYKGQRAGGVGFGTQKGEGPQVEVLMNNEEMLIFFNSFVRWAIYDALASNDKRCIFIDNLTAKKCVMGGVKKGKQNNFNIKKLRKHAITWDEMMAKIERFLLE